jgi:hypothetical protein
MLFLLFLISACTEGGSLKGTKWRTADGDLKVHFVSDSCLTYSRATWSDGPGGGEEGGHLYG